MIREKLTVIVPTFNEERNIRACLESVRWADEVIVVDSFSTDRTVSIARGLADRVLQHEYVNSAAQKNWAIPQAAHPWVMIVDADERVTPALRDEILGVLADPAGRCGFRIHRQNHFMGRPVRFCGWQRDDVLRLFRRDCGRYQQRAVHADVLVDGPVGRLRNKLFHNTFDSFDQYMKKFDRYTSWAAQDRARTTRRVGAVHLLLRPLARFVRQYVLYQGFRDGLTGLVICQLAAFSVFMKYARLWEKQLKERSEASPEKEK
ncbi:MAG: glycosyltransferase family 2 protein [Candidatus Sumerlaeia bacterium]